MRGGEPGTSAVSRGWLSFPRIKPAMTNSDHHYDYHVVRDSDEHGRVHLALVQIPSTRAIPARLVHRHLDDAIVVAHRWFRPMLDLAEMSAYEAALEQAARYANDGTFGCFVTTEQADGGVVRVTVYERWLDGQRLHCEERGHRDFDASEPDSVASSAEFLAEAQAWAAAQNDRRDAVLADAAVEDKVRGQLAAERDAAAHQLAEILAAHNARL